MMQQQHAHPGSSSSSVLAGRAPQHTLSRHIPNRHRTQHGRARRLQTAAGLDMCTLLAVRSSLDSGLYDVGQAADQLVRSSLTELSPASCGVVLVAGLLTSLSPCTLSVLPLTIGYIGGYADAWDKQEASSSSSSSNDGSSSSSNSPAAAGDANPAAQAAAPAAAAAQQDAAASSSSSRSSSSALARPRGSLGLQAVCFSLGLASSLAGLGVASSLAGRAYGAVWPGLPAAGALLAVLMGLNLLEVVVVPLPSLDVDVRATRLPPPLVAYLAGVTFALAASPCSTPVLASLLAFVSASGQPLQGGVLLLLYSCGYVAPLLVAASATGAAKQLLAVRQYSAWVTPASGVLLVAGGTYSLLTRLLPAL